MQAHALEPYRRLRVRIFWHQPPFKMGGQTHRGRSIGLLRMLHGAPLCHRECIAGWLMLRIWPLATASIPDLLLPVGVFKEAPAWAQASAHPLRCPAVPLELQGVHCWVAAPVWAAPRASLRSFSCIVTFQSRLYFWYNICLAPALHLFSQADIS